LDETLKNGGLLSDWPRILLLTRLLEPNHPAFEFAFGLEPIVELTAGLSVARKVDFIGATSDFLVTRRVPD